MGLYDSKTYISDLNAVLKANYSVVEKLRNSSILITGATGLVCSPIVDLLSYANEQYNMNIKIYLAGRSAKRVIERFPKQVYEFVPYDATMKNDFNFHVDYIIHGASNSAPKDILSHGIETMLDNFYGMYELLDYASKYDVKNVLYISSSEVYGKKTNNEPFKESEYGWVDILSPRSSYSSSKRAAETLCVCFTEERNIKTTIVRPGHVYGPTAKRSDGHVSSVFSFRAVDGKDIIMKSKGSQIRSWCYSIDAASAILTVLANGEKANAYNISNPYSVTSIKRMADLLAQCANVKIIIDIPTEYEKKSFNPMQNSSLNSEKLLNIGWQGLFDAPTGFAHTVKILREAQI